MNDKRRDHLVNEMAESAHEAWLNAQAEQGVTSRQAAWGEEFMVPFADLSERGKEFDRVIMRSILATFDRLGYDLHLRPQYKNPINKLDLDEFRAAGFFQEANRLFFHPLGLALEVMEEEEGVISHISGIWDYRDDPEGMAYGDGMIDRDKIANVEQERRRHVEAREALWGSSIQPAPAP